MGFKVETRYLNEKDFDKWDAFVSKSPNGSIYSTAEYLDILCEATGCNFKILAAMRGNDIVGGVGLYARPSTFGNYVSPRLLLNYNGIVLKDYETKYPSQLTSRHLKILSALEEALSNSNHASIRLKSRSSFTDARVFLASGWRAHLTYSYVVDCENIQLTWGRIEQNLRRLIKKCSDQEMQFVEDDDFESLFKLHSQTHDRKGSPLYLPHDQFQRYFERLKSKNLCRLYHVRLADGQAISSQLVLLGQHPVSHSVCAGTDVAHARSGAGVFIRWKVFEDLSKNGITANDLTDAALNPVTRFKSQLGADLQMSLVLSRPETFAFRINRFTKAFVFQSRAYAVNIVKKLTGKQTDKKKFQYWQ